MAEDPKEPSSPQTPEEPSPAKNPAPKPPGDEGPKWRRPLIVWVLLAVFVISLFGVFSGGNEGGTMQRTGAGVRTCVLSVPCRYIHSPSTVCAASDIEAQYRLAKAFLEK